MFGTAARQRAAVVATVALCSSVSMGFLVAADVKLVVSAVSLGALAPLRYETPLEH